MGRNENTAKPVRVEIICPVRDALRAKSDKNRGKYKHARKSEEKNTATTAPEMTSVAASMSMLMIEFTATESKNHINAAVILHTKCVALV
jgi:hypothetical protein